MADDVTLVAAADVKLALSLTKSDFDDWIGKIVAGVHAYVAKYCDRDFEKNADVTKTYYLSYPRTKLFINDLLTLTTITVNGTLWDNNDVRLYPLNETPKEWLEVKSTVGVAFVYEIEIKGDWGYCEATAVPEDLRLATIEHACRAYKLKDSAFQDARTTEFGTLIYSRALSESVRDVYDSYKRN